MRGINAGELRALTDRLSGRSECLEELGLEMYARGLSTRDIERLWADEAGRPLLSKPRVNEITERL